MAISRLACPVLVLRPLSVLLLFSLSTASLSSSSSASSSSSPSPSPFDIMAANGMPQWLLPHSITNFTFDSDSGAFAVYLQAPCRATASYWGGIPLRYDSVLRGTISPGRIGVLKGVVAEASAHLVWVSVDDIASAPANPALLDFTVSWGRLGPFYTQIPTSVFEKPIPCTPLDPTPLDHTPSDLTPATQQPNPLSSSLSLPRKHLSPLR